MIAPSRCSSRARSAWVAAWPARPRMRARVSPNSTADAPAITGPSIASPSTVWTNSTAGATSAASATAASRARDSRGAAGFPGSDSVRIEGCNAAAPQPT